MRSHLGRGTVAVVSAVSALALAACSSSSTSGSSSGAATSSTPASSSAASSASAPPSASGPSIAALSAPAKQYVSFAAATQSAFVALAALPNSAPLASVHAAAAKLATDETQFAEQIKAAQWPANAKGAITALADTAAKEATVYQQTSMAPSIAAAKQVLQTNKGTIAARVAAVAAVRAVLGIPAETKPSAASSPAPA